MVVGGGYYMCLKLIKNIQSLPMWMGMIAYYHTYPADPVFTGSTISADLEPMDLTKTG